ncbi:MAG: patatin-like phospholipase family protein [Pseudomonadota bacterium]|nr:patatin-like phospholipase family protein [Pseudomonadota bacterium]
MDSELSEQTGVVLSGGGARGSYQAGAIKALFEIAYKNGIQKPYPIITGTSAGAINAAFMASMIHDLKNGSQAIPEVWSKLKTNMVIRTDTLSLGRLGFRLLKEFTMGSLIKKKKAMSLLDTAPLRDLLNQNINYTNIQNNIQNKNLRAVAVTATNYANSNRVTFIQGVPHLQGWQKVRRFSDFCELNTEHIMASSAIPVFFPPIQVGNGYYGDGCLRNFTPLSPAIKLGASKLIVIGVQKEIKLEDPGSVKMPIMPTLARVISVITNALLMDNVFLDIERLERINETVSLIKDQNSASGNFKPLEILHIRPSEDIGKIAFDEAENLPSTLKFLIDGLGSRQEAAELISYLLFETGFCRKLIAMGYKDTMAVEQNVLNIIKD